MVTTSIAVRSIRKIPIYIWIPPNNPIYAIKVLRSDGVTEDDITNIIMEGNITDGATETIGNFTFTVDNSDQTYTNVWSLYDKLKFYCDYTTTSANTLRFTGIIEKISKRGENIVITGRSIAARVTGIKVTYTATDTDTHNILSAILAKYADYITQTNIDPSDSDTGTDVPMTVNWYERPLWECILELCNKSGYDCYIDADSDCNYFVSGSITNPTETVLHESNLLSTGDFTPDLAQVSNRIKVYGAKTEEMQIIYTAEDTTSQGSYDLREEIINDSSIITVSQAQARAEYELSLKKDAPIVGEVQSLGLPTIQPGEKIRISDPMSDLQPGYYVIQKYTHSFSNDEPFKTSLSIKREFSSLPKILKKRIVFETQSQTMENPNEMKYSWLFDFNTDSGSHTNTAIVSGVLRLATGQTSGNWISPVLSLSSFATNFELRAKTENIGVITFDISTNNGVDWLPTHGLSNINLNEIVGEGYPIPIDSGVNIKIRVNFTAVGGAVDSLMLLYK